MGICSVNSASPTSAGPRDLETKMQKQVLRAFRVIVCKTGGGGQEMLEAK